MTIEDRSAQGIRSTGHPRQDPALRGAGEGVPVHTVLGEDARVQEPADQTQGRLVSDATADALHERVWSISSKHAVMSASNTCT